MRSKDQLPCNAHLRKTGTTASLLFGTGTWAFIWSVSARTGSASPSTRCSGRWSDCRWSAPVDHCLVAQIRCYHSEVYSSTALSPVANSCDWPVIEQKEVGVRDCFYLVQAVWVCSSGVPQSVTDIKVDSHHPTARVKPSKLVNLFAPTRVVDIDQGGLPATALYRYPDSTGSESAAYGASWWVKGTVCQASADICCYHNSATFSAHHWRVIIPIQLGKSPCLNVQRLQHQYVHPRVVPQIVQQKRDLSCDQSAVPLQYGQCLISSTSDLFLWWGVLTASQVVSHYDWFPGVLSMATRRIWLSNCRTPSSAFPWLAYIMPCSHAGEGTPVSTLLSWWICLRLVTSFRSFLRAACSISSSLQSIFTVSLSALMRYSVSLFSACSSLCGLSLGWGVGLGLPFFGLFLLGLGVGLGATMEA